jgi:hypothetical protein
MYKEIKNIDLFKLEDISYNLYYNRSFVNNIFQVLYRVLDTVDDTVMIVDKNFKFVKFEDALKLVYHTKRKLIDPLIIEIFGESEDYNKKPNRCNFLELINSKADKN